MPARLPLPRGSRLFLIQAGSGRKQSIPRCLLRGKKPCGCSNKPAWEDWQYLILARRAGEKKGFIVHGFAEEFKNHKTKLDLECLKDGHKWTARINDIITNGRGCSKCAGVYRPTEQEALQKCIDICKEMNYDVVLISTNHSDYDYNWIVKNSKLVVDTRNATSQVKSGRGKIVKA